LSWFEGIDSEELFISVLALGEVSDGIERLRRRRDNRQADVIEAWLDEMRSAFSGRVIEISSAIAERWGRLNAVRPLPTVDGLLVATAIDRDLTFVTRDTPDVAGTGARVLDPWS